MSRHTILAILAIALLVAPTARAADPLHARIDAAVATHAARSGIPAAPPADDAEFLRRAYLDLVGTIPTADEARAFLADKSTDKRAKLIDRLLADERFDRNMAERVALMLMERRAAADKPETEKFEAYLRRSIAANKPLDRVAAEILCPDPADEANRDAAIFWTKRLENYGQNPVDLPGLTRDVGRLFLGVDLKCAQCHNHLTVKEYKQSDYQGLFAFVGHTYIRKDVQFPAVGEKLVDKKVEFVSVFVGAKEEVGPRIIGRPEITIPVMAKGQEWVEAPDKKRNFGGVPKFSPLKVLAEQLPSANNERFVRNLANRLWFLMAGRGVVHPLDLHHKDNPPSVPGLLEALSAGLVEQKFDLRSFVREVALSEAYQRSSRYDGEKEPPAGSFRQAQLRRLSAEQLLRAALTATGELDAVIARKPAPAAKPAPKTDAGDDAEEAAPTKPAPTAALTYTDLRKRFVAAFAAPPGEPEVEFSPTVASALFVLNDPAVVAWAKRRDGNLIDRLAKIDDPAKLADELYLSVLTRFPADDERADVATHLARTKTRDTAIGELVWALVASTEFAVNH
ncbi:MAG TPA: DUF1549 domain-containing protein [Humisphaera sp.]